MSNVVDPYADYRSGSTEPETVAVICALIRALDAKFIVETGTYEARTTEAIAKSLRAGHILTIEGDKDRAYAAAEKVATWRSDGNVGVEVWHSDALEALRAMGDNSVDFVFVDDHHEAKHVALEARECLRILRPGGVACFHDVIGPFGLDAVVLAAGGFVLPFKRLHAAGGLGVLCK